MNLRTEKFYWRKGYQVIVGIDEAGRGPLAGPVTAAAVMIRKKGNKKITADKNFQIILKETRDSKKLSPSQREKIWKLMQKCPRLKISVSSASAATIDRINIDRATRQAMQSCLKKITAGINPQKILVLIDGNRIINEKIPALQKAIVKGDDKIFSIAAASVAAKVTRDAKMKKFSAQYPQYRFHQHKGYGTASHKKLIARYGRCPLHRKSYKVNF